jgi:5-methylcytosine-specific restriction endonuclease McrA
MATVHISLALRSEVSIRAQGRCEYCHLPQESAWAPYEVDHVIAQKHGGETAAKNLAFACVPCNSYKSSDLSSVDPQTGRVVRLFNPRRQKWDTHFHLSADGTIVPRTAAGRATVRLLRLNDPARAQQRADLIRSGKLSATHS